jgi:hypothetical protein
LEHGTRTLEEPFTDAVAEDHHGRTIVPDMNEPVYWIDEVCGTGHAFEKAKETCADPTLRMDDDDRWIREKPPRHLDTCSVTIGENIASSRADLTTWSSEMAEPFWTSQCRIHSGRRDAEQRRDGRWSEQLVERAGPLLSAVSLVFGSVARHAPGLSRKACTEVKDRPCEAPTVAERA